MRIKIPLLLLTYLFALADISFFAQSYSLSLQPTDSAWVVQPTDSFPSLSSLDDYLRNWREEQRAEAYWEASVDTLYRSDSLHYFALLHRGPQYRWASLVPDDNISTTWLRRAGYRSKLFRNKPFYHTDWMLMQDSLTVAAASDGFPFAVARLDSIQWAQPGLLSAQLKLDRGPLITFAAPEVPENAQIKADFLSRYLGISAGSVYDERLVRRVGERLRQLPYLRLKANPTVTFRDKQAVVNLPVERKPASQFDFIIGVLPNGNEAGKLLITGELKGELYNGLGRGERIALRFEQLQPQTQELELAFDYPYLLNLPFGLALEADLYRRDTQFINLNYRAAVAYLWQGNNKLEVFIDRRQTNLIGFNEALVLARQQLPDTLDVGRSFFGLSLLRQTVDQNFNPSSGYVLELSAAAGTRRIRRNGKLLDLGFGPLYDSLQERSGQYNISTKIATYWPAFAGTVLYLGADAASFFGTQRLLANEQYRLGGARQLRGFNEQQIFASSYAMLTAEFRLLLGRDAFLYAFGDFAYVDGRNQSAPDLAADYPLGFGAGVNFSTRAGIFGLSLAVGKRSGEVLDFGAPKVHFGYLSVF